jgi:uncharacterized protein YvpB
MLKNKKKIGMIIVAVVLIITFGYLGMHKSVSEIVKTPDQTVNYTKSFKPAAALDPLQKAKNLPLPETLILDVPFSSQAPNANWDMPYKEACEEASMIMVEYYLQGKKLNPAIADEEILNLIKYEDENNYHFDINIAEVSEIVEDYYKRKSFTYYGEQASIENIKKLLAAGHPVIIPAAGRILANPNYTGLGPPYHMIVVIGYDQEGFITHDPGTNKGEKYHYSFETIEDAIHDWAGSKEMVLEGIKGMMVVL